MGFKVRKKVEEERNITKGEVRKLLEPCPYGGAAYLSNQLRRVFTPVDSSVVLN